MRLIIFLSLHYNLIGASASSFIVTEITNQVILFHARRISVKLVDRTRQMLTSLAFPLDFPSKQ
jgi:hypothetical protein